ncbi:MAG TPA: universal stress protein [Alphaproteobacteria bacterium]|nr:universal stress protein [Alphaproteobacteria bacterium]
MIRSVLHPSDLSLGNDAAFAHALRIALAVKGTLTILHSEDRPPDDEDDWHSFPGVRSALVRWGLLPEDAPQSALEPQLGLRIVKSAMYDPSPVRSVLRWTQNNPCDLIVMATHAREGVERWLHGSVAADLARHARLPSLFLPMSPRGFVDASSGEASIHNVLAPVDRDPSPGAAVSLAFELIEACGAKESLVHLLHVGAAEEAPSVSIDPRKDKRLRRHARPGPVLDAILTVAEELQAELIVMPTRGRHGFLDVFRGSTTERVLRQSGRPLLAVPAPQ